MFKNEKAILRLDKVAKQLLIMNEDVHQGL